MGIDIAIIEEAWRNKDKNTQFRGGYDVCGGDGKVVVYGKTGWKDKIKIKKEDDRVVVFAIETKREGDEIRIGGVYGKAGGNRVQMEGWLGSFERSIQRGILIRDWDAHDGL